MIAWKNVPMPSSMANCLRSTAGLPVPYVAAWSSEVKLIVRTEPPMPGTHAVPLLFHDGERGVGTPVFGEMAPCRQREVMTGSRCQVCNHYCGWGKKTLVEMAGGQMAGAGWGPAPLIMEPWVCASCLTYALKVCPGLVGKGFQNGLRVLRVAKWQLVLTVCQPQRGVGGGADAAGGGGELHQGAAGGVHGPDGGGVPLEHGGHMTMLIPISINCGICHRFPCDCPSAVEVTQEEPVEVVDTDEEDGDAAIARTN